MSEDFDWMYGAVVVFASALCVAALLFCAGCAHPRAATELTCHGTEVDGGYVVNCR
jgi:hypothetical protein